MKCKNCQTELEAGVTCCPNCGTENAEQNAEPVRTGLGAGRIALLVALAVAAVAVIAALIMGIGSNAAPAGTTAPGQTGESVPGDTVLGLTGESNPSASVPGVSVPEETVPMTIPPDGNPDDVTCQGSYTLAEGETFNADAVVATMGDAKLTNGDLQIYYWMSVIDFLNQYGGYASMFGLDYTKPMDQQVSLDGDLTWQQYFLNSALLTWSNYQALYNEAQANDYVLEQEYVDYLSAQPDTLAQQAESLGYESAEKMIQGDMGPGATLDGYMDYLNTYYLGYMYYGTVLEQTTVTDAEVEAYFDAHAEEYQANGLEKNDERYVDVRHILISPESAAGDDTYTDAEWAAAEKKANEVLNEWLAGDATEDSFAALAETYTMDPGSASNGGLYEGVYVGQMVPEFENWCFDASRKTGDYGIVKTDYGYHIMYYVDSKLAWFSNAETDMMAQKGDEFLTQLLEKTPAQIDHSVIQLCSANLAAGS